MLHRYHNIFLSVQAIDRKPQIKVPTVYLNVMNCISQKKIGDIRYNYDAHYSQDNNFVRMSFDVCDIKDIDPLLDTSSKNLEDIVVGGLAWLMIDNHHIFGPIEPYIVVHGYDQDSPVMGAINSKIISTLKEIGFEETSTKSMYTPVKRSETVLLILKKLKKYNDEIYYKSLMR